MNHASGKASNAVLAKARALYGRRLRAEDYRRLTDCRTMTELANELKSPAAVRQHAGRGKTPPTPAAPSWRTCCGKASTNASTACAGMTAAQAAACTST